MSRSGLAAAVVAALGLASCAGLVLYLAAGPLTTNDLWWHLAHGEAYRAEGWWPERDPCLHTAERGPSPHQWLSAVALSGVEQLAGLHGLRALHALVLAGILALALSSFRREAGGWAAACLAGCVFLVLGWYRLVQLRPELFSIGATLLLHQLVFAPPLPSWRRVLAAVLLVAVWANGHALFMLGPLLVVAVLLGLGLRGLLCRFAGSARPGDDDGVTPRALRLCAVLALGLLAALANPRGAAQHLAFLTASREAAIWSVVDEWARFDPFGPSNFAPAVSPLAWVVADLLLGSFAVLAAAGALLFLHRPSASRLRSVDPVLLGLGAAGCVGMFASIRFFWLAFFPLLFLLRFQRVVLERRPTARVAAEVAFAAGALALGIAYPLRGGFDVVASLQPRDARAWLADAYTERRFFEEGVRFLEETGVEGNLYHAHFMGGFLCHRLAPRLRTFVDGSMSLPGEVQQDYQNVKLQRGSWPHESFEDVLDRRRVDLFFGVGVPAGGPRGAEDGIYTTANLERSQAWIPVSRSMRHAIFLRRGERNRENLARVADWYRRAGVPFDPDRGLDADVLVRTRPDVAVRLQLVPANHAALVAARASADPEARFAALEALGFGYALSGAHGLQLENDREAARLHPDAKAPLRRLVYGLLRLGRGEEAATAARRLLELDPGDPRSRRFAAVAEGYRRRARRPLPPAVGAPPVRLDAPINGLPLVTGRNPLRQ